SGRSVADDGLSPLLLPPRHLAPRGPAAARALRPRAPLRGAHPALLTGPLARPELPAAAGARRPRAERGPARSASGPAGAGQLLHRPRTASHRSGPPGGPQRAGSRTSRRAAGSLT